MQVQCALYNDLDVHYLPCKGADYIFTETEWQHWNGSLSGDIGFVESFGCSAQDYKNFRLDYIPVTNRGGCLK